MHTNTQTETHTTTAPATSDEPKHVVLGADEEPPVALTPKAIEMVKEAMAAEKLEGHGLRIYVQGGGCAGFQYGLDFDNAPRPGDFEMRFDGLAVYMDPVSAMHLEGTVIDYVMGISGAGFKFNNPQAKTTCGCGASFTT
jgi:iron-sulfur cluster assembly accessory protein